MIFSNWFEKRKKEILRKSKIKTAKKVIFGTAAGSLGGLLGGLLFSPKSGKETRKDIADTSKVLKNNIVDTSKELKNNIKEKTIEIKETIDNKVVTAKDSVADAKVKISEYLNDKKPSKVTSEIKDTDVEELTPIDIAKKK